MHCAAHRTQLSIGVLEGVKNVDKNLNLLQGVHEYFKSSSKRVNEMVGLAAAFEMAVPVKMLRYVETRWLSMVLPMERLYKQYGLVALKVYRDAKEGTGAAQSLSQTMLDLSVILGQALYMPLFREVNALVKKAQKAGQFVKHLKDGVFECIDQLSALYHGPNAFNRIEFPEFTYLLKGRMDKDAKGRSHFVSSPLQWVVWRDGQVEFEDQLDDVDEDDVELGFYVANDAQYKGDIHKAGAGNLECVAT
jgi:hypothetical protein